MIKFTKELIFFLIIILISGFLLGYYSNNSITICNHQDKIKTLIRQASRWSTAASQDNNSMIAVLHANYGAGYLWALKDIYSDEDIKKYANIDLFKFKNQIIEVQDAVTKKMVSLCPNYAPKRTYLTTLGGE